MFELLVNNFLQGSIHGKKSYAFRKSSDDFAAQHCSNILYFAPNCNTWKKRERSHFQSFIFAPIISSPFVIPQLFFPLAALIRCCHGYRWLPQGSMAVPCNWLQQPQQKQERNNCNIVGVIGFPTLITISHISKLFFYCGY